jgi:hypothetical protein
MEIIRLRDPGCLSLNVSHLAGFKHLLFVELDGLRPGGEGGGEGGGGREGGGEEKGGGGRAYYPVHRLDGEGSAAGQLLVPARDRLLLFCFLCQLL